MKVFLALLVSLSARGRTLYYSEVLAIKLANFYK